LAERHRTVQELGCAENYGQDRRHVTAGLGDNRGPHVLNADIAPGAQYRLQGSVDTTTLFLFPLDEGNTFSVFAQAGKHVTVLRFGLVLIFRDPDEAASDDDHRPARRNRIDHGGDDEKAGDGNDRAAKVDRERTADRPKNDDEGRCRQDGHSHSGHEIDWRLGRHPHVVGDAIFRILVVAAHQIKLIIAAVPEPSID
jgi:hypothetical protein